MRVIQIEETRIEFHDWGARTIYPDGCFVDAVPHDIPHYHVISHRLGYADDLLAYCREHECAHELVAQFINGTPSEVLWSLAHGQVESPAVVVKEEILAQTLQRFLRANERPIVSGVKWDALRDYALSILDGEA
jgi:hypothetical protein